MDNLKGSGVSVDNFGDGDDAYGDGLLLMRAPSRFHQWLARAYFTSDWSNWDSRMAVNGWDYPVAGGFCPLEEV